LHGACPFSLSLYLSLSREATFRAEAFAVAPAALEAAGVPLNGTANMVARLVAIFAADGAL
jgi:hypothetical protein